MMLEYCLLSQQSYDYTDLRLLKLQSSISLWGIALLVDLCLPLTEDKALYVVSVRSMSV